MVVVVVEKKHSFENAPFLTRIGENGGFQNRNREKCHILLLPSAFGHFSVNNKQKRIKLLFCLFVVETKADTFKNVV